MTAAGGQVVVNGWRTTLDLTPAEAIAQLEPFFGEFLYTHVDLEGLMRGTDMAAIAALRGATDRALTAAGGITTREEIAQLDAMGVDAVVGMALYTGEAGAGLKNSQLPTTNSQAAWRRPNRVKFAATFTPTLWELGVGSW